MFALIYFFIGRMASNGVYHSYDPLLEDDNYSPLVDYDDGYDSLMVPSISTTLLRKDSGELAPKHGHNSKSNRNKR